jgi:transaldolase
MTATRILHDLGQSIWLDNITRDLLETGRLCRYIDEFSVTGLTSNPTIFDHAIKNSGDYDDAIKKQARRRQAGRKTLLRTRARRTCSGRFMTEPAA